MQDRPCPSELSPGSQEAGAAQGHRSGGKAVHLLGSGFGQVLQTTRAPGSLEIERW